MEGREDGGSVDVLGKSPLVRDGAGEERVGGVRRVEAAEGGGRRVVEGLGIVLLAAREGGGISDGDCLGRPFGRGGGGIRFFSFWGFCFGVVSGEGEGSLAVDLISEG